MGTKPRGVPDKRHASPTPEATKGNKARFVKALAAGAAPGCAAKLIGIARSTAYMWKNADEQFNAEWENAVETSLDKLESVVYKSALGGDTFSAWNILKYRRKGVYNTNHEDRAIANQNNYFLNTTLQEHYERLQRLGLPTPVIEPDYEVIDAATDSTENNS